LSLGRGSGRVILEIIEVDGSFAQRGGGGGLEFVDMGFLESVTRVQASCLFLGIVVEGNSRKGW